MMVLAHLAGNGLEFKPYGWRREDDDQNGAERVRGESRFDAGGYGENYLNLERGEQVMVLRHEDEDDAWSLVRNGRGEKGWVPNYWLGAIF